eukprot:79182_1
MATLKQTQLQQIELCTLRITKNQWKYRNQITITKPQRHCLSRNKLLLMGKAGAGKTSIKYIILPSHMKQCSNFQNYIFGCTNLQFDICDCGGSDMTHYLGHYSKNIFSNIKILVYVFDVQRLQSQFSNVDNYDIIEYINTLDCVKKYSPNAQIHCLLHKMDTIDLKNRNIIFSECQNKLRIKTKYICSNIKYFATSIWDESLYQCWSDIMCSYVFKTWDNSMFIKELKNLCNKSCIDEIALFDSCTYLLLSEYTSNKTNNDALRFEKISYLLKCGKFRSYTLKSMIVCNPKFTIYVGNITKDICVLVVISNPLIEIEAMIVNLNRCRRKFAKLLHFCLNGITKNILYKIINHWFTLLVGRNRTEVALIDMMASFYPISTNNYQKHVFNRVQAELAEGKCSAVTR